MKLRLLYCLFFSGIILSAQTVEKISYSLKWYDNTRDYRTFFIVESDTNEFYDKPVEFDINFTSLLQSANNNHPFDIASVRIIEITPNLSLVDSTLEYQFDADADFNAATKASGKIIFMMSGTTSSNSTRYYHLYFDAGGKSYPPDNFNAKVTYTDNVQHEGQSSFKIETENATYYYHKYGAGFASIEDTNGNDWVGYKFNDNNNLSYRGIPNLGDWAHPGYTNSMSEVVLSGPLKLTIESAEIGLPSKLRWEIFPNYARLTVINSASNYWFLYEGVPGGNFDLESDYVVKNTSEKTLVSESWKSYEFNGTEWLYFGDESMSRVLYFVKHEDDQLNDYYRPLISSSNDYNMTVFGFGRKDPYDPNTSRLLNSSNTKFTIGFFEDSVFARVQSKVNSSYKNPLVNLNPSPLKLSAKLFLQGPYLNGSMHTYLNQEGYIPTNQPYTSSPWNYLGIENIWQTPSNIVDWVLVEFRSSLDSETKFKQKALLLRNDGYLVNLDGSFPVDIEGIDQSDFHLVVLHRNHLSIMSAAVLNKNVDVYEIDFTTVGSAYGYNPMFISSDGNCLMRSGDANATGDITASDNVLYWRVQNGYLGYLSADFNLTGDVTASDNVLHWRRNNGQVSQVP